MMCRDGTCDRSRSDAMICVHFRQRCQFGNFSHHSSKFVERQRLVVVPDMIFLCPARHVSDTGGVLRNGDLVSGYKS